MNKRILLKRNQFRSKENHFLHVDFITLIFKVDNNL